MKELYKDLAKHAVSYAKKQGAEGCVCKIAKGKSDEFIGEQNHVSSINSNEYIGFGITVHYEQKRGTASTNLVNKKSIEDAVDQAISIAKFSIADPFLTLTSLDAGKPASSLDFLYHNDWDQVSRNLYPKILEEGLKELSSHSYVAIDRMSLTVSENDEFYMNSNGVMQSEAQTHASWSVLGMAKQDDYVSGMDWNSGFSYGPKDLEKKFHSTMNGFSTKIKGLLERGKSKSYKGCLLITPRCIDDLFLEIPLGHMSGRAVMDDRSKFADDDHGQYFHPSVTLTDHPHIAELAGSTSYDSEGIPTKERTLIKDGKIQGFLYDNYSATKLKQKPSGMSGGPFGLQLHKGDQSLKALIESQPQLLVIDRFSGNSDFTTGSFSGVAKSSSYYENGKFQGIVDETMVAGNAFELAKNVVGIENKLNINDDTAMYPHVLVDGVSVTAS